MSQRKKQISTGKIILIFWSRNKVLYYFKTLVGKYLSFCSLESFGKQETEIKSQQSHLNEKTNKFKCHISACWWLPDLDIATISAN